MKSNSVTRKTMFIVAIGLFCHASFIGIVKAQASPKLYNPPLVPNQNTAIRIAESIWIPIFGESIYNYRPFVAVLINNEYWEVKGTLHTDSGGIPFIQIRKSDCSVIDVYHTK